MCSAFNSYEWMNYEVTSSHFAPIHLILEPFHWLLPALMCRVHGEKELIFCTGPKCFFMITVNISLKKMDESRRWKVFIAIWIASGVKLKSQWAGEWADIFFPMLVQVNEDLMNLLWHSCLWFIIHRILLQSLGFRPRAALFLFLCDTYDTQVII